MDADRFGRQATKAIEAYLDKLQEALGQLDFRKLPSKKITKYIYKEIPDISSLYFVWNAEGLRYLGRTGSLSQRWRTHQKLHDSIERQCHLSWLEINNLYIGGVEDILINALDPVWNNRKRSLETSGFGWGHEKDTAFHDALKEEEKRQEEIVEMLANRKEW